jgi:hypothetical protein
MSISPKLPRHLRSSLGPEAAGEFVTILDEIRADHARGQAKFDEFARDVLARFDGMDRRFDDIDRRFTGIDHRFTAIDHHFAGIDRRFADIDRRFADIDRRFERSDDRFTAVLEKVSDVQSNLMKWSFVFWCGAVAAIAALAGVLK